MAVTGSVNQKGEVQAVNGVNEKIEGFFRLCKARRLTGRQGVILPSANVQDLMVEPEVVEEDIRLGGHLGRHVRQIAERKDGGAGLDVFYLPTTFKLNTPSPDGKGLIIVAYFVPIDDQHTQFYQHTSRKMENDAERPQWEELCVHLDPVFRAIYAQDKAITEAQKNIERAWGNEHMVATDVGVMQVRRLILKAYQAQQAVA